MTALYSRHVRCAGCRHVRERVSCELIDGRLYGPECLKVLRDGTAMRCTDCGGIFGEEDMVRMDQCRHCLSEPV